MPAVEVAQRVRTALSSISSQDFRDPRLMEVLNLSQQLVDAMQTFFGSIDKTVYGEISYIATYIAKTRDEIAALRPNDIRAERLPTAGAELEAIVRNTEVASHQIMASAERIMAAPEADFAAYRAIVQECVLEIFQACSFQDLTGQRVRKIVDSLNHIEERVARFSQVMGVEDAPLPEDEKERRRKDLLLNGPALDGPTTPQDAIDALFGDAAAVDQNAIDQLFG
jgi:chemotaxis protein CheZ